MEIRSKCMAIKIENVFLVVFLHFFEEVFPLELFIFIFVFKNNNLYRVCNSFIDRSKGKGALGKLDAPTGPTSFIFMHF